MYPIHAPSRSSSVKGVTVSGSCSVSFCSSCGCPSLFFMDIVAVCPAGVPAGSFLSALRRFMVTDCFRNSAACAFWTSSPEFSVRVVCCVPASAGTFCTGVPVAAAAVSGTMLRSCGPSTSLSDFFFFVELTYLYQRQFNQKPLVVACPVVKVASVGEFQCIVQEFVAALFRLSAVFPRGLFACFQ